MYKMLSRSSIHKYIKNSGKRDEKTTSMILIVGVVLLYLLILLVGKVFANVSPLFSVGLSWIWFLLPGLLITFPLVPHSSWWERIPLSYVLSIGLATPVTLIAIYLRLNLNIYILIHVFLLLITAFISTLNITKSRKIPGTITSSMENSVTEGFDKLSLIFLLILLVLVGILVFLAVSWPLAGDDMSILPLFAEVLSQNRITGTEPFHGSGVAVTPRNEFGVSTYLSILTSKIAGTTPSEFINNSRPVFVLLSMLSLTVLLNRFLKSMRQSLFLLCLWSIFLLSTTQKEGTGSDFVTRIFQDKFLGWFIVVPIVIVFMYWFVEIRSWRYLIGFVIVMMGASLVHPITLIQVMILSGGFGMIHFILKPSRSMFFNFVVVVLVFLASLIIPFMQYLRYTNYMPIELAGLGDAVEFGRISAAVSRYRLWLLQGENFILHPSIILQPIIIAAYVLLPLLVLRLRQDYFARLIVGVLLILPVLFYIPQLAKLVGRVVTPYLIWRLAWPFPLFAVLTIGSVIWLILRNLDEKLFSNDLHSWKSRILYPGFIFLAILTAVPEINTNLKDYNERRSEVNLSLCYKASDVFSFLIQTTLDKPVNVLSAHDLNFCIPGFVPNANVVEFRGFGTINRLSVENIEESIQRVEDVDYFDTARFVDDLLMEAIIRHKIDFVLIEKDKLELDLQFNNMASHFRRVFEDSDFRLYAVRNVEAPSKIVEGNTALRLKEYARAKDIFTEVLQSEPENILAHLGVGLAEERLGESKQAVLSYKNAIEYAPNESALHAQLASTLMIMKDFERSIQEYQIALQLSPERPDLHKALGDIFILQGRNQDALYSFEQAAAIRAEVGSASYYSILGRSLKSTDHLVDDAVQYLERAISIQPEAGLYIELARVLIYTGETDKAIQILTQAKELDRWNYLPHLELGYIYWRQGNLNDALEEFEYACRLNPANVSAYIMLGKVIKEKAGLDAAANRIEELEKVNDVLPGPYRSFATLMISGGDLESARQALEISSTIQPKSTAILSAKGYVALIAGQMETAYEIFDQVLLSNPNQISAKLGLAMYYRYDADYQMEKAQHLEILRLVPTASWVHLVLADTYRYQGDWQAALEEVNWAIKLEPSNVEGYIARGALNSMQLKWDSAISDYSFTLELDPHNIDALTGLGDAYNHLTNYSEADKYYQIAVENDPDSAYPLIQLANLYWKLGRVEEAVALEDKVAKFEDNSVWVLLRTANNYKMQGHIDEAQAAYDKAIQKDPDAVAAYIAFAQLLEEQDVDQNSLYYLYKDMLDSNPGSAEANLTAGQFFITQAKYDEAEQILHDALTYPDVTIENYLVLSKLQQRTGEENAALSTLETAVNKFPGQSIGFNELGNFYLTKGDLQKAEFYFNKSIDLNPAMISAYEGKSKIEQIKGNIDSALAVLQEAVSKNPGSPEAQIALAALHESISRIDLAEENIQKALEITNTDIDILHAAALFYLRQKRYTEAFLLLESALTLPGSKVEISLQIGNLEMERQQTSEALRRYQAANDLDKGDVRPYLAIANLQEAMGNHKEAINTLQTALEMEPASVDACVALGKVYDKLGYDDEARAYLELARKLDQSDVSVFAALSEFSKNHGDWKQAIEYLQQAVTIQPTNFNLYNSLTQLYQLSENTKKAEELVLSGFQNTSQKQEAYLVRAEMYEKQGAWDNARGYYDLAWKQEPYSKYAGLQLVEFLQRRNEIDLALTTLHQLETRLGADAELSTALGNIYASQAKWTEAIDAYQQAIKLDTGAEEAYLGLAKTYEMLGDMEAALGVYETAGRLGVNGVDIHVLSGLALQSQGKYEEARTAYLKALELEPFNLESLINLERLSTILKTSEFDLLEYVQNALDNPSSKAFLSIAQLYQLMGKWTIAHSWLQRAINIEPYNGETWKMLGDHYSSLADWEKALAAYVQAQKYNPLSSEIVLAMGAVQEKLGDINDAKRSYERVVELRPGSISGYAALAQLLINQKNSEEALSTIREGIRLVPGDYRGYEALGEIYLMIDQDNFERAIDAYQTGLKVYPGSSKLFVNIGNLYAERALTAWEAYDSAYSADRWYENQYMKLLNQIPPGQNLSQQRRSFQKMVDEALQDYNRSHYYMLAALEEYNQAIINIDIAASNYKKALALNADNELAYIGLGNLQIARGLEEEAQTYFEKAFEIGSHSSLALMRLGYYYLEIGQTSDAVDIFELVKDLDPVNSSVESALSIAYHNLTSLTASQAALSVERSTLKMDSLIEAIRKKGTGY